MATLNQKKFKLKNGIEISIRSANAEDANATLNIKRSSILEEIHQLVTPSEFKTTLESETKWIEKHLDNPYYVAIVAILNNEIVGLIDFSNGARERISHTGDFGMSVDASVRGLGIGTILLQSLINWGKGTNKIEKINLRVHSDNEIAIGLYKKMGFDIEGVQKKDLKYGPDKYVDTVLMGKFL